MNVFTKQHKALRALYISFFHPYLLSLCIIQETIKVKIPLERNITTQSHATFQQTVGITPDFFCFGYIKINFKVK